MDNEKMKELEIIKGRLCLDGEPIPCLKKFNIASSADDPETVELTICMDVRIVPKC